MDILIALLIASALYMFICMFTHIHVMLDTEIYYRAKDMMKSRMTFLPGAILLAFWYTYYWVSKVLALLAYAAFYYLLVSVPCFVIWCVISSW